MWRSRPGESPETLHTGPLFSPVHTDCCGREPERACTKPPFGVFYPSPCSELSLAPYTARTLAQERLSFCDSCIKSYVEVTTACSTDLALTGEAAIASYCQNTACSYALQQMFAFCTPLNTDKQTINAEYTVLDPGVELTLTADAPTHFAAAERALMHCLPSTDMPPDQMLADSRYMMAQWMVRFSLLLLPPPPLPLSLSLSLSLFLLSLFLSLSLYLDLSLSFSLSLSLSL